MAKLREFRLSSNGDYKLVRVCEERDKSQDNTSKKITHLLAYYLPIDDINIQTLNASNMLGMKLANFVLKSGQVYDGFDGKRLIFEVGCNTVIYTLVKPGSLDNYSFYIQGMDSFAFDVTSRSVATKVSKATAPIITIVKYEMYFLLGLVSTVSLPVLIIVVGSDLGVFLWF